MNSTVNLIEQSLQKKLTDQLTPLYTYVEGIQKQISASASVVYVIQKDKVIGEWYSGFHDFSNRQKVQENSRFNVHSVRKSYIGLVTAISMGEGKINGLDENVLDYLDDVDEKLVKDIKIRHLVTHTHGLQLEDNQLVYQFSPGKGWDYNGAGLSLLCKIVMKTTGKTVNEIIREEVFNPLRFQETSWETSLKPNLVYDILEPEQEPSLHFGDQTGFEKNLYVSGRELAHWGYLHLKKGHLLGQQILSPELFKLTASIVTPEGLKNSPQNGFFWFRNVNKFSNSELGKDLPERAYQILGSSGCTCLVIPEYDAVAVRMYNKIGNPPHYDYLRDIKNFGNLVNSILR